MLEGALRIYKVSSLSPQGEIHMVQFQRGIVIVASTAAQVDFWASSRAACRPRDFQPTARYSTWKIT